MQKAKRSFILFVIIAISCLSIYLFLDLLDLIFNNGNINLDRFSDRDVIVFLFAFSLSVFGILATVFNWKLLLLKSKTSINESEILDSNDFSQKKHSRFLIISYYIFALLLFSFGLFFVYLFIEETKYNYTANTDIQFLTVTIIILLMGALFFRDARKI